MQIFHFRSLTSRIYIRLLWMFAGLLIFVYAVPASGQPVHPDVFLNRSTSTTYALLDHLRLSEKPQIALYYSTQTVRLNTVLGPALEEAVRMWELFLVGMELPYRVFEDSTLERSIDEDIRLLIMPAAEVLSEQQRNVIKQHLQRGGGIIATGRIGFLDERGVLQNDRFFKEVFSAEPSINLPDVMDGLLQTIEGGHPMTSGLPPGFRLNLNRPVLGTAVLPVDSRPMGHLFAYEHLDIRLIEQALNISTLLLHGHFGDGRFVWMGFNPQDVSLDQQQQAVYQGLVLNAIAHVARVPALSIRRWPHGFASASSLAVLPSLGYQPYSYRLGMDLVLNALERAKIKGTYFMVTDRADDHPDILQRVVDHGELALTSDTDAMLAKQPLDRQLGRIQQAKWKLGRLTDKVSGFYPPGGFYDVNTLRVMIDMDLDYMLSDARELNVPVFLEWEDELDYRDTLLHRTSPKDSLAEKLESPQKEVVTFYPSLFSYALDDRSGISGSAAIRENWRDNLEANFHRLHESEGLFLFAFEPETMGLTQQRSQILEEFGRYIRTQNTWIATLGAMAAWWEARSQVSVEIASAGPAGYTLLVQNKGDATLQGLSLDFALDVSTNKILELNAGALEVWAKRDLESMLLVIESLPPGNHQIQLTDPSMSASEIDVAEGIIN